MKDHFLNIVLYQPEIPYNTGNIGRLCVGLNSKLHLIEPLGFKLTDKMLKRAGLDYWKDLDYQLYPSLESFFMQRKGVDFFFASTKATRTLYEADFRCGDYIIFGKETGGLPEIFHSEYITRGLTIPMSDKIRSINLCNSVSVFMYEAFRQISKNSDKI
ncbi:MAG TPA: tRNA (cytidine(34)-2'-O)-methyltransferase [Clostridiales bacterium]|jgi:tRNA (cytidine/uridine-2'-O-)-methyltransferase|nr:tRNA (cytidine(34)-2'-O)-methyltransferase [Clostridiales bacterium]HQP70050.1 tRNA (cytidine(34)-2'-O)-methyltransferase [Clostridiales bacterium]